MSITSSLSEIVQLYPRALSIAVDLVIPSPDLDLSNVVVPRSQWATLYNIFKREHGAEAESAGGFKLSADVVQRFQVLLGIGHQWTVPAFFWSNPALFDRAARSLAALVVKFLIFKHAHGFANLPRAVSVVYQSVLKHTAELRERLVADAPERKVPSDSRTRIMTVVNGPAQKAIFTGWVDRQPSPSDFAVHPRAAFWCPAWNEYAVCETGYLPSPSTPGSAARVLSLGLGLSGSGDYESSGEDFARVKASLVRWDMGLQVALSRVALFSRRREAGTRTDTITQ